MRDPEEIQVSDGMDIITSGFQFGKSAEENLRVVFVDCREFCLRLL
jgi:hypothetical protein